MSDFDVYAYGMVSVSTLYRLDGPLPQPDGYAELAEAFSQVGGEAANSSIVLARLGARVRLDGNWLGTANGGGRPLEILQGFGVDTSRLALKPDHRGVEEVVIADATGTRTILGTYVELFAGAARWNAPRAEDVRAARVVSLDPFFREESAAVSRMCRELGRPYVTIDCKCADDIAVHAAANVISGEFRRNTYPEDALLGLFDRYQQAARGLVIFTSGGAEVLYGRRGEPVRRFPAYPIRPVDTAGAGDAFRAGIVHGVLQGWSDQATVHFAAALAAYVCETFPGVLRCPSRDELAAYARSKGRPLAV